MNTTPLLTIVSITRDDSAGLQRTLASAQSMRVGGVEHIVIDGGQNAENRGGVVREDASIRWLYRPPAGIADALNAGLAAARGEWVWFLNGGDAVHETLDAGWLLSLLQHTRAEVVTGALQFDGESAPRPAPLLKYQWPLIRCWLMHPATLVRRARLGAAGGFDPRWRVAMDFELWQRLLGEEIPIDVISRPFARFATDGVSERPENERLRKKEEAAILRRHWRQIFASAGAQPLRVWRRLLQAVWLWPARSTKLPAEKPVRR